MAGSRENGGKTLMAMELEMIETNRHENQKKRREQKQRHERREKNENRVQEGYRYCPKTSDAFEPTEVPAAGPPTKGEAPDVDQDAGPPFASRLLYISIGAEAELLSPPDCCCC